LYVDSRGATLDGRPGRCWLRAKQATVDTSAPRGHFGGSETPNSDRTGLADPPEDWPAASPRDIAVVTPREPHSHFARL